MSVAIATEIEVLARKSGEFSQILTPQALEFVAKLHRRFEPRRDAVDEADTVSRRQRVGVHDEAGLGRVSGRENADDRPHAVAQL